MKLRLYSAIGICFLGGTAAFGQHHYVVKQANYFPYLNATGPVHVLPTSGAAVDLALTEYPPKAYWDGSVVNVPSRLGTGYEQAYYSYVTVARDGSLLGVAHTDHDLNDFLWYKTNNLFRITSNSVQIEKGRDTNRSNRQTYMPTDFSSNSFVGFRSWGFQSGFFEGIGVNSLDGSDLTDLGPPPDFKTYYYRQRVSSDGRYYYNTSHYGDPSKGDYDTVADAAYFDFPSKKFLKLNAKFGFYESWGSDARSNGKVAINFSFVKYNNPNYRMHVGIFQGETFTLLPQIEQQNWLYADVGVFTPDGSIIGSYFRYSGDSRHFYLAHGSKLEPLDFYVPGGSTFSWSDAVCYENGIISIGGKFLVPTVPEPTTWIGMSLGLLTLLRSRRKRDSKRVQQKQNY